MTAIVEFRLLPEKKLIFVNQSASMDAITYESVKRVLTKAAVIELLAQLLEPERSYYLPLLAAKCSQATQADDLIKKQYAAFRMVAKNDSEPSPVLLKPVRIMHFYPIIDR